MVGSSNYLVIDANLRGRLPTHHGICLARLVHSEIITGWQVWIDFYGTLIARIGSANHAIGLGSTLPRLELSTALAGYNSSIRS